MKISVETVKDIIKYHIGKAPTKEIRELHGGLVNFIYYAEVDGAGYVVRLAEEQPKIQYFMKEQWAIEQAREKGVPVPEILEVSNEGSEFPYMITRWVKGRSAESFLFPERAGIVKELGKYAALINSIPTSGFGHVFDWSSNQLSRKETWKQYLQEEFGIDKRLATLERHSILAEETMSHLRGAVKEMMAWEGKPHLNHGDLRLKNVLCDDKGKICCVLDWEFCTSNMAPQWDMSIAMDAFNVDEKALFLEGYGMSHGEYRKISQGVKVINLLNFAPFVDMAFEEKNEAKRKDIVDGIRTRMRGCFDLYSLE